MTDSYHEFRYIWKEATSYEHDLSMKYSSEASWTDLCEYFVNYLQGCGFIVSGQDVRDYYDEAYEDDETSAEIKARMLNDSL